MGSIDLARINQVLLHKQHLADDSKSDDIVQIVRDVGGLHATGSTIPYLSLFQRTGTFAREDLDEELYVKRSLCKIRCVRGTIYVIPREMISVAYSATNKMVELVSEQHSKYLGVTQTEYEEISRSILTILAGTGMTAREIKNALSISAIYPCYT